MDCSRHTTLDGGSDMITKCSWCKQPIAGWVPVGYPHHPDCFEYGERLMKMGWTPTRDYRDTPEIRKAMREQFQ